MSKLAKAALELLGLAGAGAVAAYDKLSSVPRKKLEAFASKAAGTTVTVRQASVTPWSGAGRVRGLVIGNPAGFKTDCALRVDEIRVRFEPRSLLTGTVRVREVVVDSPVLTWELGAGGGNLGRIRSRLRRPPASKRKGAAPNAGGARRVIVDRLIVRNGRLRVAGRGLGLPLLLPLPDLELKDIGGKSGGATAREALSQALDAMIRSAIEAAGGAGKALRAAGKAAAWTLGALFGGRGR